jgi:hypothetical protein
LDIGGFPAGGKTGDTIPDPDLRQGPEYIVLVVVIGATHNESANLLYLGESHEPDPTACIYTTPIIHSQE